MYENQIEKNRSLLTRLNDDLATLKISQNRQALEDLKLRQGDPVIYQDFDKLKKINIEIKKITDIVEPWEKLKARMEDLEVLLEMAEEENDASHKVDAEGTLVTNEKELDRLELRRFFQDEMDPLNTYLTIHAGAGGTESCDWAMMLYRMYSRWAESRGFQVTVLEFQDGDEAGLKSVTLFIEGPYAHGYLKCELGVHRLVRISPFDANKRRHTSFSSVYATPEVDDDIDVVINTADLRVDTYRASGAGGQHVNKTDSAVRLTHIPTGIVVSCQAERSQIQNREKAMKLLKARLYEKYKADREAEMNSKAAEKKKIEWGSQIRSYVLHPYQMVKDHRTDWETSNAAAVLDGALDDFIQAYLRQGETLKQES
jgi:peptide chain release factor 2